ncbi:DAK2 domain-containing protein [Nonomuraea maritima]|uniref:DAK2 domain-containing protein n=1 Tax=Nonomuraea maritima TaxID=683260 RepID=UPI00372099D2
MEILDPTAVRRWARRAADELGRARTEIDALNVFPVADGDTGTNLHLTLLSAAEAVEALPDDVDPAVSWQTLAYGALVGARGNSGVIVSQALRGLAEVLQHGPDLRAALIRAAALAREAVARPVEGTVLSVLESAARAARETGGGPHEVARRAAEEARVALRRTPGQLEVLARSGVVDAGGAGVAIVLEALAEVVAGAAGRYEVPAPTAPVAAMTESGAGYEVMYLLDADDGAVAALREELDAMGDSLVVVGGDGLWNVHVHVRAAGPAVEAGIRAGRPHRISVTYLAGDGHRQHPAGRGVVAVVAGEGVAALFERCGAVVVRRATGALPPVPEVLAALRQAGREVVVVPDDESVHEIVVAAARSARQDGVTVEILPAKATVQGLAALAVHDPGRGFADDVAAMTEAARHTRYAHIAAREGGRPDEVVGVVGGEAVVTGGSVESVAVQVVDRMVADGGELVTLVTGARAPAGLASRLQEHLGRAYPGVEVVVYDGAQDGHPLLVGVE